MHCAGIEAFIMNMYRNIDRSKIQFDFLVHYTKRQFYDDEIERLGGRIFRLSFREDKNFFKYIKDLHTFFQEHKEYKIVHAHMESFALFYLPFAKKAGIPVIIAHSHNDRVDPTFKGCIKNLLNKPFKYMANEYMACSKESADYLFGNRKCWVIPNAIDAKKYEYDERKRVRIRHELNIQNQFVIGHVGRFNIQKNHTFLIDVFNELYKLNENVILLLFGEGELRETIEQKVNDLGLSSYVRFLGIRNNMYDFYSAMDAFVFPSLYEGLGIVGIEAQAASLKTICSEGIPQIAKITNYVTSLNLNDSLSIWAETINSFSKGYERISTYHIIAEHGFDIKNMALELENFYLTKSDTNE